MAHPQEHAAPIALRRHPFEYCLFHDNYIEACKRKHVYQILPKRPAIWHGICGDFKEPPKGAGEPENFDCEHFPLLGMESLQAASPAGSDPLSKRRTAHNR